MGANGQIRTSKKKMKREILFCWENDEKDLKNAEPPPIYSKWALGR